MTWHNYRNISYFLKYNCKVHHYVDILLFSVFLSLLSSTSLKIHILTHSRVAFSFPTLYAEYVLM